MDARREGNDVEDMAILSDRSRLALTGLALALSLLLSGCGSGWLS